MIAHDGETTFIYMQHEALEWDKVTKHLEDFKQICQDSRWQKYT